MIDILAANKKDGSYYVDPYDGKEMGPYKGPNNLWQSIRQRYGVERKFRVVWNMQGRLEWPPDYKRSTPAPLKVHGEVPIEDQFEAKRCPHCGGLL